MRFAIALLAAALAAQTPITAGLALSGPAVSVPGSTVTLTVGLTNGGGPAGLQWDMTGLPAGALIATPLTGKGLTCNVTSTRCILEGTNAAPIPDGPIATITYTAGTAPVTATLAAVLGATPAGAAAAAITAPAPVTIAPQSKCDINGDGKVDATDIGLEVQAALASTTGSPTILDVVRVIIAANGGACLR